MKYYRFYISAESSVIGKYPQIHQCIVPTTVNDPNYIDNFFWEKVPEFTLLPQGILDRKAKKTDLISVSFIGFSTRLFVSCKLGKILENFNYWGLQYLPTTLIDNNSTKDEYWIINPYYAAYECLDFDSSLFSHYVSSFQPPEKKLVFKNASDFIKVQDQLPSGQFIQIERICLKSDNDKDFFAIKNVSGDGTGYFVSQRLKDKIQDAGCIGMVFKEPNEIYP